MGRENDSMTIENIDINLAAVGAKIDRLVSVVIISVITMIVVMVSSSLI